MGNVLSNGESRMAIAAMANVMNLTMTDVMVLRDKCLASAAATAAAKGPGDGNDQNTATMTRKDLLIAMAEVGIGESGDGDVLDKVFTMFDKTGDDRVHPLAFLVGISPLASLGDHASKLLFAFEVQDVEGRGALAAHEMLAALSSINATASYFGDPVMAPAQIEMLVQDVLRTAIESSSDDNPVEEIRYGDHIYDIASHPLVGQFVAGEGTVRYGGGGAGGK